MRTTRDKLTPELQNELQGSVGDLRTTYERLLGTSMDWLKGAKDLLERLKRDKDETVSNIFLFFVDAKDLRMSCIHDVWISRQF